MSFPRRLALRIPAIALLILSMASSLVILADGPDFDVRPVPIKTPPPEYPSQLRREGITGVVAVKALIDETGSVTECTVVKSTNPGFDEAAMEALKKWKFKPAQKDGNPVKAKLIIPIQFQVNE